MFVYTKVEDNTKVVANRATCIENFVVKSSSCPKEKNQFQSTSREIRLEPPNQRPAITARIMMEKIF